MVLTRRKRWMKKADFEAWVNALRSGEYRQARGVHCEWDPYAKDFKMCVTGVALDVCVDAEWVTASPNRMQPYCHARYSIPNLSSSTVFGTEGREAAMRVQSMNDHGGWNFGQLAEWINSHRKEFCGS